MSRRTRVDPQAPDRAAPRPPATCPAPGPRGGRTRARRPPRSTRSSGGSTPASSRSSSSTDVAAPRSPSPWRTTLARTSSSETSTGHVTAFDRPRVAIRALEGVESGPNPLVRPRHAQPTGVRPAHRPLPFLVRRRRMIPPRPRKRASFGRSESRTENEERDPQLSGPSRCTYGRWGFRRRSRRALPPGRGRGLRAPGPAVPAGPLQRRLADARGPGGGPGRRPGRLRQGLGEARDLRPPLPFLQLDLPDRGERVPERARPPAALPASGVGRRRHGRPRGRARRSASAPTACKRRSFASRTTTVR